MHDFLTNPAYAGCRRWKATWPGDGPNLGLGDATRTIPSGRQVYNFHNVDVISFEAVRVIGMAFVEDLRK
ncbi:hypothetical protein ABZX85_48345 [Streptomyces sp. NPDC004539]|uniref:hypothetical protein n=1 Tax=Streptomyces sp. NPDC004539 TaxID=3154280 RepID=UPI0033A25450